LVAPFFLLFGLAGIYGQVRIVTLDGYLFVKILSFILYCIPDYIGITALLALLWVMVGKEQITITATSIQVQRILFKPLPSRVYARSRIKDIHVDTHAYRYRGQSPGRNDFLYPFRVGTLHFIYDGQPVSFAGGLTDWEGHQLLREMQVFQSTHLT